MDGECQEYADLNREDDGPLHRIQAGTALQPVQISNLNCHTVLSTGPPFLLLVVLLFVLLFVRGSRNSVKFEEGGSRNSVKF